MRKSATVKISAAVHEHPLPDMLIHPTDSVLQRSAVYKLLPLGRRVPEQFGMYSFGWKYTVPVLVEGKLGLDVTQSKKIGPGHKY